MITIWSLHQIFVGIILSVIALTQYAQVTKYDNKEAFYPQFYPYPGNEIRSASGEPGPKYWQNHADYRINCTLDTAKNSVSGEVEINYTNNSPDVLNKAFFHLYFNAFQPNSMMDVRSRNTRSRTVVEIWKPTPRAARTRSSLPSSVINTPRPASTARGASDSFEASWR